MCSLASTDCHLGATCGPSIPLHRRARRPILGAHTFLRDFSGPLVASRGPSIWSRSHWTCGGELQGHAPSSRGEHRSVLWFALWPRYPIRLPRLWKFEGANTCLPLPRSLRVNVDRTTRGGGDCTSPFPQRPSPLAPLRPGVVPMAPGVDPYLDPGRCVSFSLAWRAW